MKNLIKIVSIVLAGALFAACEVEDPFVDRIQSPVLVNVFGTNGVRTTGLTTDPTISATYTDKTQFGIEVLELDKTNLLDYTKGIDSIPVTSLTLKINIRNGAEIGTVTTDGSGVASVEMPWSDFGITAKGQSVSLSASGTYKNVPFTKLFKLAAN